ncbi:hypothetical protein BC332_34031 [Capsicum chinense]|nr:hypothetical protein BC332_34031 [Capsicum chinense]
MRSRDGGRDIVSDRPSTIGAADRRDIMSNEIKYQGSTEDRLVLLKGVSGDFRPVVLIASMGVSGAGKTTLMDVLAGRKTGGYVNGDIKISGYPKKQETFVEKMKKRMRRTLKNVKILDGFCNLF